MLALSNFHFGVTIMKFLRGENGAADLIAAGNVVVIIGVVDRH